MIFSTLVHSERMHVLHLIKKYSFFYCLIFCSVWRFKVIIKQCKRFNVIIKQCRSDHHNLQRNELIRNADCLAATLLFFPYFVYICLNYLKRQYSGTNTINLNSCQRQERRMRHFLFCFLGTVGFFTDCRYRRFLYWLQVSSGSPT